MILLPPDALVDDVLAGKPGAWHQFWAVVGPQLDALVRRPQFLGRLSRREDDCRNIVVEVLAALQADDHARLRRYVEARRADPRLRFWAWLSVVAKRLAIDYLRRHDEYLDLRRTPGAEATGAWVESATLPADSQLPGERPPLTDNRAAHELIEYAAEHLEPAQASAVAAWAHGAGFDEIARRLELATPADAEKLVRAALERLRRRFRGGDA